jgi:histone H3/H4
MAAKRNLKRVGTIPTDVRTILKSVDSKRSLSREAASVVDQLVQSVTRRVLTQAEKNSYTEGTNTLKARHIQQAVQTTSPPEIASIVHAHFVGAMKKFEDSKKKPAV